MDKLDKMLHEIVDPNILVPQDILEDFLNKKDTAIKDVQKWILKNGKIILFCRGMIQGWENVYCDDEGYIHLESDKDIFYQVRYYLKRDFNVHLHSNTHKEKYMLIYKYLKANEHY